LKDLKIKQPGKLSKDTKVKGQKEIKKRTEHKNLIGESNN